MIDSGQLPEAEATHMPFTAAISNAVSTDSAAEPDLICSCRSATGYCWPAMGSPTWSAST